MAVQQPGAPVLKALALLRLIAGSRTGIGLQEAALGLETSTSTAHRILRLLVGQSLATYDTRTRLYGVGPDLLRLAAQVMQNAPLGAAVRQVLRSLVDCSNETACLAAYLPAQGMLSFLAIEECTHPLRYVINIGRLQPLHLGASGKAILAFLPAAEIERLTPRDADREKVLGELDLVRRQGFAFSQGERIPGAVGIAAPIFNSARQIVGDLVITLPAYRYREGQLNELAPRVMEHAARVSTLLGPGALEETV